jgi:hypothetical protein
MAHDSPDFPTDDRDGSLMPTAAVSYLQILGWDGALPLFAASVPIAIKTFWPDRWPTAVDSVNDP